MHIHDTHNDRGHHRVIVVRPHELLHDPHQDRAVTVCRVDWTGAVNDHGRVVDERITATTTRGERVTHDPEAHHTPSWLAAVTPEWTTTTIPVTRWAVG